MRNWLVRPFGKGTQWLRVRYLMVHSVLTRKIL